MDIAPRYAGTLFGVSNTVATFSGIFAPFMASAVAPNVRVHAMHCTHVHTQNTQAEWMMVFGIAATVLVFGAIFFAIFASGELQPWAVVTSAQVCAKQPTTKHDSITTITNDMQLTRLRQ